MQTMYLNGSNNYAIDSMGFTNPAPGTRPDPFNVGTSAPAGSIQVFTLPTLGPGGVPVNVQTVYFAPWVLNANAQYEAAFSKCKGDFSYYKSSTASVSAFGTVFQPCGVQSGDTYNLSWGVPPNGSYTTCQVRTGETWYLNWRIVPGTGSNCGGTTGHTCGQTFFTSGS